MNEFSEGNRLPVPSGLPSRHFLYKTAGPTLPAEDVQLVVDAAKALVERQGLYPGQVELYGKSNLLRVSEAAALALDRLYKQLEVVAGFGYADLVVCEQAFAHSDPDFAGRAFLTGVLHTGPEAYYLQMFHTRKPAHEAKLDFVESTRRLDVGDWFIMDPTTPHLAVPRHPNSEALLVLLQVELPDLTLKDRQALVKKFPPLPGDRDINDLLYDL